MAKNAQDKLTRPSPGDLDIYHIISLLPIMPYHEIADICCGVGTLSVPLGKAVYRGKVTAFDSDKANLTVARRELKNIRLSNVQAKHMANEKKLPLKDESLDGVMASFFKQASKTPSDILGEAHRVMRNGAWLALMEWRKDYTDQGPVVKSRISQDECRAMAEDKGFRFYMRHDFSEMAYMLLFLK